jgi:hypothetical protein
MNRLHVRSFSLLGSAAVVLLIACGKVVSYSGPSVVSSTLDAGQAEAGQVDAGEREGDGARTALVHLPKDACKNSDQGV